ncbi:MAG: hypothetical protein WCH31_05995 [Actinomycetes bacterium]
MTVVRVFLISACLAAAAAATALAAQTPLKPLSSLGRLEPAPPAGRVGAELVPIPQAPRLAPPTSAARPGKPVDGIPCQSNETLSFHHHVHLELFVNGRPRVVPAGIGIWPPIGPQNYRAGQFGATFENCQAWLSTHYADGIVHVEAPAARRFTLGELFDIWGQPLGTGRLGPVRGAVITIVNGKVWTGAPRLVPLEKHTQITLEIGRPLVQPTAIDFPGRF